MSHVFNNMTELFTDNVNEVMDRMDDPEQMVLQLILDMEESYRMVREAADEAMASKENLSQDLINELNLMGKELDDIRQKAVDLNIRQKAA